MWWGQLGTRQGCVGDMVGLAGDMAEDTAGEVVGTQWGRGVDMAGTSGDAAGISGDMGWW